jgi:hypothetical protein
MIRLAIDEKSGKIRCCQKVGYEAVSIDALLLGKPISCAASGGQTPT